MMESPGNIRHQLGRSLNMIRVNIEQEDVLGLANHVRFTVTLCSPYLDEDQKSRLRLDAFEDEDVVFERCMKILDDLLTWMAAKGLYAWQEEPIGDASGLALGD